MMALGLTLAMACLAIAAMFASRGQHSLGAMLLAALMLAARVAMDDALMAAALVVSLAVLGPVAFLHLRRHEASRQAALKPLVLLMGLALALVLVAAVPPLTVESGASSAVASRPMTGLVVLICAVALLIGTSLAVRIREGRRQ
jgi:hypothetical protein